MWMEGLRVGRRGRRQRKQREVALAGLWSICLTTCAATFGYRNERNPLMSKILIVFALLCVDLSALAGGSFCAFSPVERREVIDSPPPPRTLILYMDTALLPAVF